MFRNSNILIITSLFSSLFLSMNSYAGCIDSEFVTATTGHLTAEISEDGLTVYDSQTNLTWQRCSVGQSWSGEGACDGVALSMNWQSALQAPSLGWRLPNIKELGSIMERQCYGPTVNEEVFPGIHHSDDYWSSSPDINSDGNVWSVSFYRGSYNIREKDRSQLVLLVRSGPIEPIIDLQ